MKNLLIFIILLQLSDEVPLSHLLSPRVCVLGRIVTFKDVPRSPAALCPLSLGAESAISVCHQALRFLLHIVLCPSTFCMNLVLHKDFDLGLGLHT